MDIWVITGTVGVQRIGKLTDSATEHCKMVTVLVTSVYQPLEKIAFVRTQN
jgi:hypothetical protein